MNFDPESVLDIEDYDKLVLVVGLDDTPFKFCPSTDIEDAWEVVNEITKNKHWTFKIINYAEKNSKPYKQSHKNEV